MKKRVVSLLLCLIMALSLIPTVAFAAEPVAERQQSVEQLDTLAGDPQATALLEFQPLGWKYAKIEQTAAGGLTITKPSANEDLSDKVTVTLKGKLYTKPMNPNSDYETVLLPDNNTVTISVEQGYYIDFIAFCCSRGDGYDCTEPKLLLNGTESTTAVCWELKDLRNQQNSSHEWYRWLMISVKECPPTPDPTTGTLTVTKNIVGLPFAQVPVKAFEYIVNLAPDYAAAPPLFTLTVAETAAGITAMNSAQLNVGQYSLTESHLNSDDVAGYKHETTFALNGTIVDTWDYSDPNDGPEWPDFNIVAGGTTNIVITDTYTPIGNDENNYATISIKKYETGDNAKKPIGGAKFYLEKLDKNSTVISGTYYDTVAGKALTIGNLTEGNYRLTEAEAPFGYQKVNTVWTFTVTKTTTTDINSENQQVTTNTYKITKVDNSTCDEATHVFDVANTKLPNVTAKVTITKNVNVTGNTQPTATTMPTFQFVAKVDNTEVGKLSLTPKKDANGKWTASGDMTVSIPANLFVKDNVTVTISEVIGNLNYWTYDKNVKSLQIAKDGTKYSPVIVNSAAEVVPTDPTIASFTFTNEYKYTYTPTTRPSDPIRRQPTTTTTKPVKSVKTGDMGIALYAVTSLLSLSGTALLIKKRKDEK